MANLGNLESVVLRELRVFLIAAGFRESGLILLIVDIRNALKEQQWESVGFEVRSVHGTT